MRKLYKKTVNKLWGGAFSTGPSQLTIQFTAGRDVKTIPAVDYKLLSYDIWGSKSHCLMLYKQKIINKKDAQVILKGLLEIEDIIKKDKFLLDPAKEDVHTNIESYLINKYGIEHAGKLHTARSRNDQANLDSRLFLRDQVLAFSEQTILLSQKLISLADKYKDYVMPGFTHHQHAMVTTFGHILLGYAAMLNRDAKRFLQWFELYNFNPLGNSVAYGTAFPIDRVFTSQILAFSGPDLNSHDQITNRWEAEAALAFAITTLMNHLSSFSQTLILFSMMEFGMVTLSDEYSTGSSIMPQKKNPDPLEVIKAKTSLASGQLQSLISLGKANFVGYNRDSQWAKYLISDLIDECLLAPSVLSGLIETMKVNKDRMLALSEEGFIGTTSLLEQLASHYNLPFRKAKILVEQAIKYSQGNNKITHNALTKAFKENHLKLSITEKQVIDWQDPLKNIEATNSFGGPGLKSIKEASIMLNNEITKIQKTINDKLIEKQKALALLNKSINNLI